MVWRVTGKFEMTIRNAIKILWNVAFPGTLHFYFQKKKKKKKSKMLPLQTKNIHTQNENRRLDFIKSLH